MKTIDLITAALITLAAFGNANAALTAAMDLRFSTYDRATLDRKQ